MISAQDEKYDQSAIDGRAPSVARLFLDRVQQTPSAHAYSYPSGDDWKQLTWAQADERVRAIAGGLVAVGVQPGDRVAIASATRVEWALADLGVMLAAAATTTIYPTSTPDDVLYIVSDSGSTVVIAEDEAKVALLKQGRDAIPDVTKVVVIDGAGDGDWVLSLADLEKLGTDYVREHEGVLEERVDQLGPQDLATLIYTSGTTGKPKGVRLPHDAWMYEVAATGSTGLLTPDDLQYLWLPLSHVFGKLLLTLPIQVGFPTAIDGRVDKIVENLAVVRPTWMGAAPRIFEKVYGRITTMMDDEGGVKAKLFHWASANGKQVAERRSEEKPVGALLGAQHRLGDKIVLAKIRERFGGRVRFFISGSAALNSEVAKWFDAMGMPVLEGYGMTETSAATCVNRPYANKIGTVGWPLPGTELKLADDGELLVKGPGVMQGYRGLDEATAETLSDGWLHTGDIAEILPSGHVRITDRKKDLFKTSNGKYVAPGQIEATFKGLCPYASQLVVEGESRTFVSALITLDEEAITDWAKNHGLAGEDYRTIVTSDAAREMVQSYVDKLNAGLNRWEQIKRFLILDHDLTVEDGEITPSLKLKRKVVITKYGEDLDALYA
ncbi:long-chain fatty acid--CoA ligase [Allobranchiibius sp. CTAmp26]|uniref:AMP-dependent synthetase/ligase n=1 Tax=Allobranchiibius sp. CTAmp26 TaxID=2815214 RepID=UPI001AA13C38|nr:long-chain fatty acid--CoA ligase [Allobranchiibius sp. CTAmp26]MBO1756047.1 long-chain fatty acid--CoA ligase [Allobranchiibius sp. CTAmp26]